MDLVLSGGILWTTQLVRGSRPVEGTGGQQDSWVEDERGSHTQARIGGVPEGIGGDIGEGHRQEQGQGGDKK